MAKRVRTVYRQKKFAGPQSIYVQVKWPWIYTELKGHSRSFTVKDMAPMEVVDLIERALKTKLIAA